MMKRARYPTTLGKLGLIAVLAAQLCACTVGHTPDPVLPSRGSIAAGESITVQGNQNIYAVARAHNVSMREMIVLNNLQPPFALKPGQQLVLPAGATSIAGEGGAAASPMAAPSGAIQSVELAPIEPAPVLAAPVEAPAAAPQPAPGAVQSLNAPAPLPKPVATTVAPQPAAGAQIATANPQPITPPPSAEAAPAAATAAAVAAPAGSISMVWPLQGPILSGFGDKGTGVANDGINIGAPKGSSVVAAAGGTVVYVGNEMKGFGNLILIRHESGWVTAYAHLDRTLVAKDSVVAQGDMIGTVGKTGNVSSPQLHFETRHDGKPVDPRSLIGK